MCEGWWELEKWGVACVPSPLFYEQPLWSLNRPAVLGLAPGCPPQSPELPIIPCSLSICPSPTIHRHRHLCASNWGQFVGHICLKFVPKPGQTIDAWHTHLLWMCLCHSVSPLDSNALCVFQATYLDSIFVRPGPYCVTRLPWCLIVMVTNIGLFHSTTQPLTLSDCAAGLFGWQHQDSHGGQHWASRLEL